MAAIPFLVVVLLASDEALGEDDVAARDDARRRKSGTGS
jgi:hypothetical protein